MKKASLIIAATLFAGSATAGSMSDPIVSPPVTPVQIIEDAQSSSAPSPALVMTLIVLTAFSPAVLN
ncbi:MAG: hypothetical protein JXQ89_05865 [Pelagimonas sp.]|jgi:hypothetical protein